LEYEYQHTENSIQPASPACRAGTPKTVNSVQFTVYSLLLTAYFILPTLNTTYSQHIPCLLPDCSSPSLPISKSPSLHALTIFLPTTYFILHTPSASPRSLPISQSPRPQVSHSPSLTSYNLRSSIGNAQVLFALRRLIRNSFGGWCRRQLSSRINVCFSAQQQKLFCLQKCPRLQLVEIHTRREILRVEHYLVDSRLDSSIDKTSNLLPEHIVDRQ
jgi:hypothetical protein